MLPPPFRDPPPFTVEAQGHRFTFHPGGPDRLAALMAVIDGAQHSLRMAFYIFDPDASGTLVRDALVRAARRGVRVDVVLDSFGSRADAQFFAPLVDAGGSFCCFMPRWDVRYLIRNHQKMVVADGRVAMLGGFNVADSYFAPPAPDAWTDLSFTVEGPVVARVAEWFDQLHGWALNPQARLRGMRRLVRKWQAGDGPVRLLVGGPTRGPSGWAHHIGGALKKARRLDMMMAYFSPPPHLSRRIGQVARRGDARVVMSGRSDNGATVGASRAFYTGLLKRGVHVWEHQATMLHTKLIVADDTSFIGSANFDMRSLYLNMEIMLAVDDPALAARLRRLMDAYQPAARRITPALHRQQATWWNRLRWWTSWVLVGVIDYTVSRRLNLGL